MNHSVWLYIMVMALVSYLLRVLPLTLIRKQIKNRFIKSLLFYLPYVTLSVMTVPAILLQELLHGSLQICSCLHVWHALLFL